MPLPPVVVELGDAPLTPALRESLLRACNRAVEDGECVDGDVATVETARAVVILGWSGDGSVRIQVGLRDPPRWRTRLLGFAPEDDLVEICTAVGFAAGTLATAPVTPSELDAETDAPPVSIPAPVPPTPKANVATTPAAKAPEPPPAEPVVPEPVSGERRMPAVTADAAMVFGTGIEPRAPRMGPAFALSLWNPAVWSVMVRGDAAWVVAPPLGMRYSDYRLAAGVGASTSGGAARWSLRTFLGVDGTYVQVTEPTSGRSDRAARWVAFVAAGPELEWPCARPLRLVLGGEAAWPFGTTDFVVAGAARENASRLHGAATLGLRAGAPCRQR